MTRKYKQHSRRHDNNDGVTVRVIKCAITRYTFLDSSDTTVSPILCRKSHNEMEAKITFAFCQNLHGRKKRL